MPWVTEWITASSLRRSSSRTRRRAVVTSCMALKAPDRATPSRTGPPRTGVARAAAGDGRQAGGDLGQGALHRPGEPEGGPQGQRAGPGEQHGERPAQALAGADHAVRLLADEEGGDHRGLARAGVRPGPLGAGEPAGRGGQGRSQGGDGGPAAHRLGGGDEALLPDLVHRLHRGQALRRRAHVGRLEEGAHVARAGDQGVRLDHGHVQPGQVGQLLHQGVVVDAQDDHGAGGGAVDHDRVGDVEAEVGQGVGRGRPGVDAALRAEGRRLVGAQGVAHHPAAVVVVEGPGGLLGDGHAVLVDHGDGGGAAAGAAGELVAGLHQELVQGRQVATGERLDQRRARRQQLGLVRQAQGPVAVRGELAVDGGQPLVHPSARVVHPLALHAGQEQQGGGEHGQGGGPHQQAGEPDAQGRAEGHRGGRGRAGCGRLSRSHRCGSSPRSRPPRRRRTAGRAPRRPPP